MSNTLWDPNVGNITNPNFSTLTASSLTVGTTIDQASGIAGKNDYQLRLSLPVTAVTNTDYTMSLPTGCTIKSITVYTTTAYTGTTANLTVGSASAGAQYVAATDIHAIGIAACTFVAAGTAGLLSLPAGTPNLFLRIAQSTTPTAVGAATLLVSYVQA